MSTIQNREGERERMNKTEVFSLFFQDQGVLIDAVISYILTPDVCMFALQTVLVTVSHFILTVCLER